MLYYVRGADKHNLAKCDCSVVKYSIVKVIKVCVKEIANVV